MEETWSLAVSICPVGQSWVRAIQSFADAALLYAPSSSDVAENLLCMICHVGHFLSAHSILLELDSESDASDLVGFPKGMDMTSNDFWIAAQTEFGLIKADCFKLYPNDKTLWDTKCDYRTSDQCKRQHWSSSI
jgi:hypothetical protein